MLPTTTTEEPTTESTGAPGTTTATTAAVTGALVEYAEATLRQAVQGLEATLAHARNWLRSMPR